MVKARVFTTDEEIDEYLRDLQASPLADTAVHVQYLSSSRLLLLQMKSGRRLAIPVEEIEEIAKASDEQLSHFEIEGAGLLIHFPDFDGNLDVSFLLQGRRGSETWERELVTKREAALTSAA